MSVPFMIRDEATGETTIERRYHGRVLREWENNGYNDSDWYVLVLEDDQPAPVSHRNGGFDLTVSGPYGTWKTICYSTTRGGSAPANADVDATEEVLALNKEHWAWVARVSRIRHLRSVVREARELGLASHQWMELRSVFSPHSPLGLLNDPSFDTPGRGILDYANGQLFYIYESLRKLKANSFRSSFKRSLAEQILAWVTMSATDRTYDKPLSPKQMEYVG